MRAHLDNFISMLSQKLLQLALNHLHCAISVATALVWRAAAWWRGTDGYNKGSW